MDVLKGIGSALFEGGMAILLASSLDSLFWKKETDEPLPTLLLRFTAQVTANGAVLATLAKLGALKFDSNTGLILFAVLFIAGQDKLLLRFKTLTGVGSGFFSQLQDGALTAWASASRPKTA